MARILIVDDALFMRKMLGDLFIESGHEIVGEAHNAKQAIELYKTLTPDLITLDIVMPEVDEINSIQAVRAIKTFDSHARIIMVSAMGQQDIITESIQAGASDFIIKPFQKSNVIETVTKFLKK